MPTRCATCEHPQVRQINQKLREGRHLTDISRWLDETDKPITRQALARHMRDHLGVTVPHGGNRPVSGDFLAAVVDRAHEGLADGSLAVTVKDGIAAQAHLDQRMSRNADRDLLSKIAMALTGAVPMQLTAYSPEMEAIEAEFRPLLTSGE